jgi:hypothetical protein
VVYGLMVYGSMFRSINLRSVQHHFHSFFSLKGEKYDGK